MKRFKHTSLIALVSGAIVFQFQNCGYFVELEPEQATVALSTLDVTEEGEDLEVTVFVNDRKNGLPLEFTYEITSGPYGSADDFVAMSGTVAVDQSITIDDMVKKGIPLKIPTFDDDLYEGADEEFTLTIRDPTGNFLSEDLVLTLYVVDNDGRPAINIGGEVIEEEATPTMLEFTVTTSIASAFDTTIVLSNFRGNPSAQATEAMENMDYAVPAREIILPAEQTSVTFSIEVLPDNIYEARESAAFDVTSSENATVNTETVTFDITNPVGAKPILVFTDISVPEANNETITINPTLQGGVFAQDVTYDFQINMMGNLQVTDFVANTDFTGSLTIPAGQATGDMINLTVENDDINELNESFGISLSNITQLNGEDAFGLQLIGPNINFSGMIMENDPAQIVLTAVPISENDVNPPGGSEARDAVTVAANRPIDRNITFNLRTLNGNDLDGNNLNSINRATAGASNDFMNIQGNNTFMALTLTANEAANPSETVQVVINDDNRSEATQSFIFEANFNPAPPVGMVSFAVDNNMNAAQESIFVPIMDNDGDAQVSLIAVDADGNEISSPIGATAESNTIFYALKVDPTREEEIVVNLNVNNNGSASNGDYMINGGNMTVTIPANANQSANIPVMLVQDNIFELEENFTLRINNVVTNGAERASAAFTQLVTIMQDPVVPSVVLTDEDGNLPTVNVFTIDEPDSNSNHTFEARLNMGTTEQIHFDLEAVEVPGEALDSLYFDETNMQTNINSTNITTTRNFNVNIKNNDESDGDKYFEITLTEYGLSRSNTPTTTTYMVIIQDNDD